MLTLFLARTWNWFNGNKTAFGGFFFFAAWILQSIVNNYFQTTVPPDWMPGTIGFTNDLGAFFSGVGLVHKGIKAVSGSETVVLSKTETVVEKPA